MLVVYRLMSQFLQVFQNCYCKQATYSCLELAINTVPVTHFDCHQSWTNSFYHQTTYLSQFQTFKASSIHLTAMKWMSLVAIGVLVVSLLATNSQAQKV